MKSTGKLLIAAAAVVGFTGAASAADLYVPPPAPPVAAPAPAASGWDGLYLGVFAGYAQGHSDNTDSTTIGDFDYSGGSLGIQGGYNFHLSDTIVAGVSADLAWSNASGTDSFGTKEDINWNGSVTGRVGADLNGIVPYVLGGVAFENGERTSPFGGNTDTQTHTGYTVGAGVEFMLADNLSADIEYRYSDYGSQNYSLLGNTYPVRLTDNSVRIGLNYHF